MNKGCKVIVTAFNNRESSDDRRLNYPRHQQKINGPDDIFDMLQNIVKMEKNIDAGMPVDVIIVNNENGYAKGNNYINTLHESPTVNGKILTITRKNEYGSFGGYNEAFRQYGENYDYWLFTEDDILISGDDYYSKIVRRFNESEKIGFVSLVGTNESYKPRLHAHGGVGLTSKKILNEIKTEDGNILLFKDISEWDRKTIVDYEVKFTNQIHKLGYKVPYYGSILDWDFEANLCAPYHEVKEKSIFSDFMFKNSGKAKFVNIGFHEDDRAQRLFLDLQAYDGQINVSYVDRRGQISAYHMHKKQTDYWICLKGSFKVGLAEPDQEGNYINRFEYLSDKNFRVLKIPPGVYHGYMALEPGSILMYYLTQKYDPADEFRNPVGSFGETWEIENK